MKQVSDKRAIENRKRAKVLAAMRKRNPHCQARCIRECTDQPNDGHEILSRARGGSITDPENILLVCRPCHTWITEHPREATELGLMASKKL